MYERVGSRRPPLLTHLSDPVVKTPLHYVIPHFLDHQISSHYDNLLLEDPSMNHDNPSTRQEKQGMFRFPTFIKWFHFDGSETKGSG